MVRHQENGTCLTIPDRRCTIWEWNHRPQVSRGHRGIGVLGEWQTAWPRQNLILYPIQFPFLCLSHCDAASASTFNIYQVSQQQHRSKLTPLSTPHPTPNFRSTSTLLFPGRRAVPAEYYYEGAFVNGMRSGYGLCTYHNKSKYEGQWNEVGLRIGGV